MRGRGMLCHGDCSGGGGRRGDQRDEGVEGASCLEQTTRSKTGDRQRRLEVDSTNNVASAGTARGGCGRGVGKGER